MSVHPMARKPVVTSPPLLIQVLVALTAGVILFFMLAGSILAGFSLNFSGRVYPGVSVAGVNLSGLTRAEVSVILSQHVIYPQTGKILFQDGESIWVATPSELGLVFDHQASAQAAYDFGRRGNPFGRLFQQLRAWRSGVNLPPLLIYDERTAHQYVGKLAEQVDLPTVEASLTVNGVDVTATPGQIGRLVDVGATLSPLEEQLRSMTDGLLPLVVEEAPPEIMDASEEAEIARQILSKPLRMHLPNAGESDPGPWEIEPERLAMMLKIERVGSKDGSQYQVGLNEKSLNTYLSALSPEIGLDPSNARFIFNDDTELLEVIQPAVTGRVLDVYSTIQDISEKVRLGEHTVPMKVSYIEPEVGDDATGEQLGITELVSWHTSYFRGSSSERLNNIKVAAENFHGLMVPPGATFSMANTMGNVSLDNGYAEAWIIFGGRTIKGVGGGVCQVSTTLFRTVFFGGYPIVERYPHAYRVGYYEQTRSGYDPYYAGLDATVFVPMVDFKFVNDTPYWLLMETYFNPTSRSLTWKFYSTSDGREVEWDSTGPENVVEPPEPRYEENPELAKGVIKQVDWAADGADVTVTRTVWRDGEILYQDIISTYYRPWRDVFQYGPGTELPKLEFKKKKKSTQG